MRARPYVAAFGAIVASISSLRGEYIGAPPSEAIRFMRDAEQVLIFPNPKPDKPRRDDKRMRLLTGEALRSLIRLVGHQQNWYVGWDNRFGAGPPPKDIGLLFRRGRDELVLFFYPGEMVDARFNGQRQDTRWSLLDGRAYKAMEQWKVRYARRELEAK